MSTSVIRGQREASMSDNAFTPDTLNEKLSAVLINSGIQPRLKGFDFLKDSVRFALAKPDSLHSLTKTLYPFVAVKHSSNSRAVERAVRHAIEVAWAQGKLSNLNRFFGFTVLEKDEKPTGGEYIGLLTELMKNYL